jgi:ATP-binding cassette subfamily C protein
MLNTLRQCLSLLDASTRRRWIGLAPLAATSALLETVGAAAIFALIKIVSDPAQAAQFPGVSTLVTLLPWQDNQSIVLSFTLLMAMFYLVKNGVLIVAAYLQSWVVTLSIVMVSRRLLKAYLSAPYAFHFQRNSAELIRNVDHAVETVFRFVLAPAVAVVSESLVIAGLVTLLLIAAPASTLAALIVLGGLFALMVRLTRRFSTRWGAREQELKHALLQTLQQSLGGVKEIKVMGRERFFHETFSALQQTLARTLRLRATLSATPHVFVETVFVCGILAVVMVAALRGGLQADLLPLLGLYAYAGFRIIPATNRLLMHINAMHFGSAAVERLARDFQLLQRNAGTLEQPRSDELPFTQWITLARVSYCYDGAVEPALRDIDISIQRGESVGVVGPTGSGKSTLIDLILGLLHPSSGCISVDGRDIATCERAWQRKIGYVPQSFYLLDDSLRHNIAFGVEETAIDEQRVRNAIRLAQLEPFVASLPRGLETVVGERGTRLSGGERQRVAIARALYHEPEVLIFDEATSALDNQTERELTRAIEALQGQKTVIVIAHRLSTVRHCDRLFFLRKGRLAGCGSFAELLERNADFRALAALAEDEAEPSKDSPVEGD